MRVEQKSFLVGVDSQKEKKGYLIKQKGKNGGSIFAGNLNMQEDPIKKKKEAQQKAMKVISDTFAGEQKIDNDLKDRANHIEELRQGIKNTRGEINDIEQDRANLKEQYQIKDESQEEKDLELLEKRRQSESPKNGVFLTKEDTKRLKEIDEAGVTDYQKRSLELNGFKEPLLEQVEKSKNEILVENAVIEGINQARLKSSPMLEADQQAESIMDAASDEIVGMLIKEAKDHIDEEQKKNEEEAEKLEEEKEKEEEIAEDLKEKLEEKKKLLEEKLKEQGVGAEEITIETEIIETPEEDILKISEQKNNIKIEIEKIADKLNLLMEDLKGSVVDSKL